MDGDPVQVKLEVPDYGEDFDPVAGDVHNQNGVKQEVEEDDKDGEDGAPQKRRRSRKRARASMAESSELMQPF